MNAGERRTGRLEAQAKVNLFLRVLGREPSGYHQLATLFQRVEIADTVTVRTGGAARALDMSGSLKVPPTENLAWRAAEAFMTAAAWPTGFAIEIEKRIPAGGGMGGGSADAAAVLRILNALAPSPLDRATLYGIAFALGADVPYLVSELGLALGTGRGEKLREMEPLPSREVALWIPPFGVASKDAFGWYATDRAASGGADGVPGGAAVGAKDGTASALRSLHSTLSWPEVASLAANDLEAPVFRHHPELALLRDELAATGPLLARMSGSGSTLFAVYDGAAPAAAPAGCHAVSTKTVAQVASVDVIG